MVSPFRAAYRIVELASETAFWHSVLATCLRVLLGFFIALGTGSLLAVTANVCPLLKRLLLPLLNVIKATPVASFIILTLIWMSSGAIPVFIVFLMVTPITSANVLAGIQSADPELLEMSRVYQFSKWKRFHLIYFPTLLPYFLAACSTGMGFAWKSAIAAEVISHPGISIGARIYDARIYLQTADLFAWTVVVVLLSLLLEKATIYIVTWLGEKMAHGLSPASKEVR